MNTFKGFDKDLKCRDFQYEIGGEYEEDRAEECVCGFHACEHPLDVLGYYPPVDGNRYCEVEQSGDTSIGNDKIASTKIKIGAEIGIQGLIKAAFKYTKERCTNNEMGGYSSALTGGDRSALTGGYSSALTGGDRSALTGGDSSALTGGYSSALTGGDSSALTGGNSSALTGGDSSALTGGNSSALTGGDNSVVYGNGKDAKVRGGIGAILALAEYDEDWNFIKNHVRTVDGKKIKADTYYMLKNGRWTEAKESE